MNERSIGIAELITASYLEFSVRINDIQDRLNNGTLQSIRGINDFVYSKAAWNILVLFRVTKVRNQTYDGTASPNSLESADKMIFTAEPMGSLVDSKFKSGASYFPMVGTPIYSADETMLKLIFDRIGDHRVNLGYVSNYPGVRPDINLKALLTSHIAILGNTGSGKSTTLRVLLGRLNSVKRHLKRSVKFIVFDVHGDYSQLSFAQNLPMQNMHLPLSKLTVDDWEAALLPSEKTQKPILRRTVQVAHCNAKGKKLIYAILARMAVADTTQDSFVALKRSVTKWYDKVFESTDKSPLNNWIQHFADIENQQDLSDKIETAFKPGDPMSVDEVLASPLFRQDDLSLQDLEEAFEIVFGEEEVQGNRKVRVNAETMMSRFRNIVSRYGDINGILNEKNGDPISLDHNVLTKSKFWVVDLTGLDDDALRLVSNYLTRSVFERRLQFKNKKRSQMPFNYFFLDEAHRYVKQSQDQESTIFERIAREGRKFNVYLGIISQIPSELSKVVLSQTGAYFIHRIQNSQDLAFIQTNVPSATSTLVSRLPSLPAGTALLSGNAFEIPFELVVEAGDYGEVSKSISPFVE